MPPLVGVKMELRSFINLNTGEYHDYGGPHRMD